MQWIADLFTIESAAQIAVILALVVGAGLALGSIRIYSISLGIAGVLFAGLLAGHLLSARGIQLNTHILEFVREFGLILFVYTIGIQVGPGFFASLRRQGLPLNLMAVAIVILGGLLALLFWRLAGINPSITAGLFAGATTNTPSLAAAQQALKDLNATPEALAVPGMAYAMAYPFGIVGIILTMLLLKAVFRINPQAEAQELSQLLERDTPRLDGIDLEVRNSNLNGLTISQFPGLGRAGIVISRVMSNGQAQIARRDTVIHIGDVVHAVGPREKLEELKLIVGSESPVRIAQMPGAISARRILVTKARALGRTVVELNLNQRFGAAVTRVNRADVELPPAGVRLQFGDTVVVVGEEEAIKNVAEELGDSVRQLNHPQIIPVFVGIALGVIIGSLPLNIGLPAPVKLGLAGGPLIVAILLSRLGNVGPLVWYMPASANFMLRELGIVLFLACVGLRSGVGFWATLTSGQGLLWMGIAAIITLVPLFSVALIARALYKMNYLTLCGLLAGSMTDPPALAFAGHMTGSDAPSVSYATVYPLVMLLRVLVAQMLVLILH